MYRSNKPRFVLLDSLRRCRFGFDWFVAVQRRCWGEYRKFRVGWYVMHIDSERMQDWEKTNKTAVRSDSQGDGRDRGGFWRIGRMGVSLEVDSE